MIVTWNNPSRMSMLVAKRTWLYVSRCKQIIPTADVSLVWVHFQNFDNINQIVKLSTIEEWVAYLRLYSCKNFITINKYELSFNINFYRFLDSLVVECWLWVREVPGSIPSNGPQYTKDVIKMIPLVPLFGTQH